MPETPDDNPEPDGDDQPMEPETGQQPEAPPPAPMPEAPPARSDDPPAPEANVPPVESPTIPEHQQQLYTPHNQGKHFNSKEPELTNRKPCHLRCQHPMVQSSPLLQPEQHHTARSMKKKTSAFKWTST